jgi:hypothetical protein
MKILLIGFGFVGKATYLLNNKDVEFTSSVFLNATS